MKTLRISLGLTLVAVVATSPVWSRPGYGGSFDTLYPTSASDDNSAAIPPTGSPPIAMDCLLCHGFYNFDAQGDVNVNFLGSFNPYGWAIRNRWVANGNDLDEAIQFVENQDSDGDANGHTNLQEILAGTQPGWKPGNVNTIERLGGAGALFNQPPPTGLIDLDPVPGGVTYCTANTDSIGCTASIATTGVASLTSGQPYDITASNLRNNTIGAFFWGTSGAASTPIQGGAIMCVAPPAKRTFPQFSMGSMGGPDCSGSLSFEANQGLVQNGSFAVGDVVNGQFFVRDPGSGAGFVVSDAVEFIICP